MGHDTHDFSEKQANPFVSEPNFSFGDAGDSLSVPFELQVCLLNLVSIHAKSEFY